MQIQQRKADPTTILKRDYAVCVPATLFYPVAAKIAILPDNKIVWSFDNSDLVQIMEAAWAALHPESSEILNSIKMLPEVISSALPYQLADSDNTPQLVRTDFIIEDEPKKLKAKDRIVCCLCSKIVSLKDMRQHVGVHILRYQRDYTDSLVDGIEVSVILLMA